MSGADWLAILRYVRPIVFCFAIVVWALIVEPLFASADMLAAFDAFLSKRAGFAWAAQAFHGCLSYVIAVALEHLAAKWHAHRARVAADRSEAREREEKFENRARLFRDCSYEEKLFFRAFIDLGVQALSSDALTDNVRRLAAQDGLSDQQLGAALGRLRNRNLIFRDDSYVSGSGWHLSVYDFAFLSEHPNLIGSGAPVRYVDTP